MKLRFRIAIASVCLSVGAGLARGAERPVDTEHSTITIHVGKAGLFSIAGHEHKVSASIAEGGINDAGEGHIRFRVDAHNLTVLPEKDQAEVQATMQKKVLESDRFPEIRFESTKIQKAGENGWKVEGNLTLHGQTHAVMAKVRRSGGSYAGSSSIKQTEFGIQPVTAGGGTVKVKDELEIEFSVQPRK